MSSLGLELGAERAKLSIDAGERVGRYHRSEKEDGVAPVVGLRFTATPSEPSPVNVQGQ